MGLCFDENKDMEHSRKNIAKIHLCCELSSGGEKPVTIFKTLSNNQLIGIALFIINSESLLNISMI